MTVKKTKIKKTTLLKINNIIDDPKWKKIKCKCKHGDIENSYPLIDCTHCNCNEQTKSIPSQTFTVKDKDGNDVTITEISLVNGKFDDVIGWNF